MAGPKDGKNNGENGAQIFPVWSRVVDDRQKNHDYGH
jgi:hypothetical protein